MKSAKERAEYIEGYFTFRGKKSKERERDIAYLLSELEAYAEERIEEMPTVAMGEDEAFEYSRGLAEGRRAGLEEAAKVAERCIEHYSKDEPMVVLHSNVFKMIRALKESEI